MTVRAPTLQLVQLLFCSLAFAHSESRPWTILPISQGRAVLAQCSRDTPEPVTGFWTPSVAQIDAIEQRLPKLLRSSGHKIKLGDSHRQYIGFIFRGKRLIYLNAFPADDIASWHSRADWKKTAWIVCDGGDVYWGVEFDPATQTF